MALELNIAPAETAPDGSSVRQRRGWLRRMYSPVGTAGEQGTAPPNTAHEEAPTSPTDGAAGAEKEPRARARGGGWVRRLVSREHALGRRWKLSGAPSRLAAGLRWKRLSSGLKVGGGLGGGCATALLDTVTFRVMYVVEAVVLGLALSCFFCCCGCQI